MTAAIRRSVSSIETISMPVTVALPSRVILAEVDSSDSSSRPFMFSFARSSSPERILPGTDVLQLRRDHVEALAEVLLARADVDADLAGVDVLRPVGVDGVRHAALLADLLEEARRGRAAEDGIEQGRRIATRIVALEPRAGEADVVLLGVLALKAERRRGARPAGLRGSATRRCRGRRCDARRVPPRFDRGRRCPLRRARCSARCRRRGGRRAATAARSTRSPQPDR